MDLILLRHGEAEDAARPDDPADDAIRRLTDAGKKKLARSLPQLRLLLDNKKQLIIWASPLVRARETADMLVASLADQDTHLAAEVSQHEFIATGDWPGFVQAAKTLDPGTSLVLVGHEPHWGHWSQRLCGCLLPFKKGAAACFDFDPFTWDPLGNGQAIWKGQGQLQWFVQPRILKKLRP
jgi:phosphohistidine phosphatase